MKAAVIIVILILYMAFMLYIGLSGKKYAENFSDFLTAGKQGKLHLTVGSYVGGHVGTGIVVGGATYGVAYGIGGIWFGLGAALSYALFGLFVAKWARSHNYLTIPTYLRERYPKTGKLMTIIWAILGACVAVTTLTGQIIAGRALFSYIGVDPLIGTIVSVIVIAFYCGAAGMFGVIATDFWQSIIIIVGLVIAMFCCFSNGGWTQMITTLPESSFNLFSFDAETLILMLVPTAIYGLTSGASMQLTASADSDKTAVRAPLIAAVFVALYTLMPVLLGMYGATEFPEAEASSIIFTVIINKLPTVIAGLMLAAIVAAVMSTCDTTIMTIITSLVFDAYGNVLCPMMGKKADPVKQKKASSIGGYVLMLIAMLLAFVSNDIVGVLSSGYTIWVAGGMIPFLAGRLWKRTTSWGSLASMIVGSIFAFLNLLGITHFPTSLFCLIPAAITVVIVSLLTPDEKVEIPGCR